MKRFTKVIATAAATATLLTVGVTAARAVTPPEGGTWNYGVTGKYTYSNYLHNTRTHKATAVGATTAVVGWTSPGVWANAQAISAIGGNKAYYDVK